MKSLTLLLNLLITTSCMTIGRQEPFNPFLFDPLFQTQTIEQYFAKFLEQQGQEMRALTNHFKNQTTYPYIKLLTSLVIADNLNMLDNVTKHKHALIKKMNTKL